MRIAQNQLWEVGIDEQGDHQERTAPTAPKEQIQLVQLDVSGAVTCRGRAP